MGPCVWAPWINKAVVKLVPISPSRPIRGWGVGLGLSVAQTWKSLIGISCWVFSFYSPIIAQYCLNFGSDWAITSHYSLQSLKYKYHFVDEYTFDGNFRFIINFFKNIILACRFHKVQLTLEVLMRNIKPKKC